MKTNNIKCDQCGKEHPADAHGLNLELIQLSVPNPSKETGRWKSFNTYDFCDAHCLVDYLFLHKMVNIFKQKA